MARDKEKSSSRKVCQLFKALSAEIKPAVRQLSKVFIDIHPFNELIYSRLPAI